LELFLPLFVVAVVVVVVVVVIIIIPFSFIYSMLSFFLINLEPAQTESCEETGVVFSQKWGQCFNLIFNFLVLLQKWRSTTRGFSQIWL